MKKVSVNGGVGGGGEAPLKMLRMIFISGWHSNND